MINVNNKIIYNIQIQRYHLGKENHNFGGMRGGRCSQRRLKIEFTSDTVEGRPSDRKVKARKGELAKGSWPL